jgi:hypothetical protein
MTIRQVGAEFHADRHDKDNSHALQYRESAQNVLHTNLHSPQFQPIK